MQKCENCNETSESWLRCSGCKLFLYCSSNCAKLDWKTRHKYICQFHKSLSTIQTYFLTLPSNYRLELLITHLVLVVFNNDQTNNISPTSSNPNPLISYICNIGANSIQFNLPFSVINDLPNLAVRWYNVIARSSSLLAQRDSEAYLDLLWKSFDTNIHNGELGLNAIDVRVAVLFVRWKFIWKPSLQFAYESFNITNILNILKQMDYTHFLVPPSLFSSPGSGAGYMPPSHLSWLVMNDESPWLSATLFVKQLYTTVYYEMAQQLLSIAMLLSTPGSWSGQVEHRILFAEHMLNSNKPEDTEKLRKDAVITAAISLTLEEEEHTCLQQRLTGERFFDAILLASSPSLLISNFAFMAFNAFLTCVAVSNHPQSLHLVNEVLFRRGYFPYSPSVCVYFNEIGRTTALAPLFTIIVKSFLTEIVMHGVKGDKNLIEIPLSVAKETIFLEELSACERFYRARVAEEEGKDALEAHSCRWCSLEFDTNVLSRFLVCLLFLIRISNLPLFNLFLGGNSSDFDSFVHFSSRLSNLAMQKGRMRLSSMSKEMKKKDDVSSTPVDEEFEKAAFDTSRSNFSLAFCHLLIISPRVQHPVLDTLNKQTLYFTCLRAALLTRFDYWTLVELTLLLCTLTATDGDFFPDHSCLLSCNYRLTKQSNLLPCVSPISTKEQTNITDSVTGIPPPPPNDVETVFATLPSWVACPQKYKATVLKFDQSLLEEKNRVYPMPQIIFNDGGIKKDHTTESKSALLLPFASTSTFSKAISRYYLAIQWARLAAVHPEANGDFTEVVVPLLVDLLHRDSCPNQLKDDISSLSQCSSSCDSIPNPKTLSEFRSVRDISLTANCCTLHPGGKNVELPNYPGGIYNESGINCNVEYCWKTIWHLLYGDSEAEISDSKKEETETAATSVPNTLIKPYIHSKGTILKPEDNILSLMSEICFELPNKKNFYENSFSKLQNSDFAWMAISSSFASFNAPAPSLSLYPSFSCNQSQNFKSFAFYSRPSISFSDADASQTEFNRLEEYKRMQIRFWTKSNIGQQKNHDLRDFTSSTLSSYSFLSSVLFLPALLLSSSPSSLDALYSFGYSCFFGNYKAVGLMIQPLLALRCLILHALLAPSAWSAYLVAYLIQQQLLPTSSEILSALSQDICVLLSVLLCQDVRFICDNSKASLFSVEPKLNVESLPPISMEKSEWVPRSKSSRLYSSTCAAVQTIVSCIFSELGHLQEMISNDQPGDSLSFSKLMSAFVTPQYPSYSDIVCLDYYPYASALLKYAEVMSVAASPLILSVSQINSISALKERINQDVDDIKATLEAKEQGLELILSDDEEEEIEESADLALIKRNELKHEQDAMMSLQTEFDSLHNEIVYLQTEFCNEKEASEQASRKNMSEDITKWEKKVDDQKRHFVATKHAKEIEINLSRVSFNEKIEASKKERNTVIQEIAKFDSKQDSKLQAVKLQHESLSKAELSNNQLLTQLAKQTDQLTKQIQLMSSQIVELKSKESVLYEQITKKKLANSKSREVEMSTFMEACKLQQAKFAVEQKSYEDRVQKFNTEKEEWQKKQSARKAKLDDKAAALSIIEVDTRSRQNQTAIDSETLRGEAVSLLAVCQDVEKEREILLSERKMVEEWIRNNTIK